MVTGGHGECTRDVPSHVEADFKYDIVNVTTPNHRMEEDSAAGLQNIADYVMCNRVQKV